MRTAKSRILITLVLAWQMVGVSQEPMRPSQAVTVEQERDVSTRLSTILQRYKYTDISIRSDDYRFLWDLQRHPEVAIKEIDELIRLTVVRETPLHTTEEYDALRLSPTGMAIVGIGAAALPKVEEALKDPKIDPWQRLVLKDVVRDLHNKPMPNDEVLFQYGWRDPDVLYPRNSKPNETKPESAPSERRPVLDYGEKSPLPRATNSTPIIPVPTSAISAERNSSLFWPIIIVVALGISILGWLFWRRRI